MHFLDDHLALAGLEVDIRGLVANRLQEHEVQELDHRRLAGEFLELLDVVEILRRDDIGILRAGLFVTDAFVLFECVFDL